MKNSILIALIMFAWSLACAQTEPKAHATRTKGYFVPATAQRTDSVAFTYRGGAFQSYGCKPVDPTYWMSGGCCEITITFARPEDAPSIRVWGMNTDDVASVKINGQPYSLSASTAYYNAKVVCGTSLGEHGVLFADGLLVGANTPSEGNYSYQDVVLNTSNVVSITITALKGAGWGFAGVSVYRGAAVQDSEKGQGNTKR